ncbi:MAG: LLM class flavin-dependent oxidoreductase [Chloroflexia bacterium]|nr:LLM class flavin-dependent oxidoreductase [Chloroflexia bacterium]
MRFGIFTFSRAPYDAIAQTVRLAEELGFTSAWVNDDLMVPDYADFEPWTLLGALARDTACIRLGTMVTAITFRHPSLLAAQVHTLDHLSDGRVNLGLGAGGPPHPYRAFGQTEWPPRERVERLAEQAVILDTLLRGESATHAGPHYPVRDARLAAPVQRPRPPLVIAAHGDRALRVAARYADGWNTLAGQPYPAGIDPAQRVPLSEAVAQTRQLSERLDAICADVGRDPATIQRSQLALFPNPDPFSSLAAFDEYVGAYAAIGIEELIFYWPPIEFSYGERSSVPAEIQTRFERIAAERIAEAA